jgi:thiol-disulfide isomerase/thioredoxin
MQLERLFHLLLLSASAHSLYDPVTSRCVELTDKNFDEIIVGAGTPLWINFYNPECPHCKAASETWEAVADKVNPKDYTNSNEKYPHPILIGCMDCVKYEEKCNKIADMTGYPKFILMGVDKEKNAEILEYDGKRELIPMLGYATMTHDLSGEIDRKIAQEDDEYVSKRKEWRKAELFFERTAIEANSRSGMKILTPSNFDSHLKAALADGATLLVVAMEKTRGKWFDAWVELADRAHKLKGHTIVVARMECNNTPRLCFDNERVNIPERMDIFPLSFLYNKKYPGGEQGEDMINAQTWQDVAKLGKLLNIEGVEAALEKVGVDAPLSKEEQEMFDEL